MKVTILAVGRLRPPYVDDVAHYLKMLRRYASVEVVEVREDDDVARRVPERAFAVLLDAGGRQMSSEEFARWLEERGIFRDGDLALAEGPPWQRLLGALESAL